MKTLVCLGDSWPQGGELQDPTKSYGHLLRHRMGFDKFFNYGKGGASNEDSLDQFLYFIENFYNPTDQTTVLVHLTNPARSIYWPHNQSWSIEYPAKYRELFLHFHQYDDFRSSLAVSTLQAWCNQHKIADFYFSGWVRYNNWLPVVNVDKIWAKGNETASDWFGASDHNGEHLVNVENNQYISPNYCHPNERGHQLIADKLCHWISKKQ
jgi:hypothetical protein